jgi:hypothetical protein
MKTKTNVRADAIALNHNQTGIPIRSKVKAGKITVNHNQTAVIRSGHSRQAQTR